MRYWFRRQSNRQWLAALTSLAIGAAALVAVVLASPGSWNPFGGASADASFQPVAAPVANEAPATNAQGISTGDLAAAFNCARQQQALPDYIRDEQLDREAQQILTRLQANGEEALDNALSQYTLRGQLLLNGSIQAKGCTIGGFDIARIKDLDKAAHIGVAVAELPDPTLPPFVVAVVIGR